MPGAGRRRDRVRRALAGPAERPLVEGPGRHGGSLPAYRATFAGENFDRNLSLVEALRAVADAKGAHVAQLAIAWVLSRGEDVVALVGARRRDQLAEAMGAIDVEVAPGDLAAIERAVPAGAAAGDRYHAPQMASIDSERGGTTAG